MKEYKYTVGIDKITSDDRIQVEFFEYDTLKQAKEHYKRLSKNNLDKHCAFTLEKIKRYENGDCEIIKIYH